MAVKFNHTGAGDVVLSSDAAATLKVDGNKVWHEGNDGSGSTLDADRLDGQEGSYYLNASNISSGTLAETFISFTDITTGNATASAHGFLRKLTGSTANFLRADGTWAAPTASQGYQKTSISATGRALVIGEIVIANSASGALTYTLPTIDTNDTREIVVIRRGANVVNINRDTGQTIETVTDDLQLDLDWQLVALAPTSSTNWAVVNRRA